jgi:hypothetical protein
MTKSHAPAGGATGTLMQTSLFARFVSFRFFTPAQFLTVGIPGGAVPTTTKTVLLWLGCSVRVGLVHVMLGGPEGQLQPPAVLGLNSVGVKPEGRLSVTVVVGGHGAPPTLVTLTTKANG